jgi:glyoxylase-like metal-dependent hydrolase (beta-lactamase superfamily II)
MRWTYEKGLHDLGNGGYAWLAPDGSWGWSNAGLIVDGEESLLVDTLFDLRLTQEMLDAMRDAEPRAANRIGTLVNTHANGDHCHGNQLVEGAAIIASAAAAEEMAELPPEAMAGLMKAMADDPSPLGQFFRHCFGSFEFEGIRHTPPTQTFEGEMSVMVGSKTVELIQVGPAHTRGDVLVHVAAARTVFTGDILFIDGTPIMWAGPRPSCGPAPSRAGSTPAGASRRWTSRPWCRAMGPSPTSAGRPPCGAISSTSGTRRVTATTPGWRPSRPPRTSRSGTTPPGATLSA